MTERPRCDGARREARGFVLPVVLVTLLLIATLAGATNLGAWRAVRAARLAFNGERALQGADEAVVSALAAWDAEDFAARAIGERWQATAVTGDAGPVTLWFARSAPLVAAVMADMRSRVRGSPDTASRRVTRYAALLAPAFPVRGAVTALGALSVTGVAEVDGRDTSPPGDGCGTGRDTSSVAGVYSDSATLDPTAMATGSAAVLTGAAAQATITGARIAFDSAWGAALTRVARSSPVSTTSVPPSAPAWSAQRLVPGAALPASPAVPSHDVEVGGSHQHVGLLLVDGNLVVTGSLLVEGMLVVRGRVDARDGALRVSGALVVRDAESGGSHLGTASRIRYSQCSAQRALATIARPATRVFGAWVER